MFLTNTSNVLRILDLILESFTFFNNYIKSDIEIIAVKVEFIERSMDSKWL